MAPEGPRVEYNPKAESGEDAPIRDHCGVVGIAADRPVVDDGVPVFHLDDISAIADFIERVTGLVSAPATPGR